MDRVHDITKMRNSSNQSPQSLLIEGTLVGSKLHTSYLDKVDPKNRKLSKHMSQQGAPSRNEVDRTPRAKQAVSTDLAEVVDNGLDGAKQGHPAPIRQQDDLTPDDPSESKTDAFLTNNKNLVTQEAILSSHPSKGKVIMSQIEPKVNEPSTALIGHQRQ